jgi:siroheme synthase-like protein
LEGRRGLGEGAGPVAAGKLRPLLNAGARVTVVAPDVSAGVDALSGELESVRRPFTAADLDGVWYVVAAAPPDVNREVSRGAELRGLFVNAVDDMENASAYLGAIVQRAGVTLAISTDGEAPALAGLLREALEVMLPDDLERWMALSKEERRRWLEERVPMQERRPQLLEALNRLYAGRERSLEASPTHTA